MRRAKTGEPIFDDIKEAMNWMDDFYSLKNIKKRALKKDRPINYEDKLSQRASIMACIDRLPKSDEKSVIGYIMDCVWRGVSRELAIHYLATKVLKVKIEVVVDLERKAIDKIKDKLSLIITPGKFGDIINN